jgi:hypothetical protein
MIRWAKRDEVFTSGVKLVPVEKKVVVMTDREKMIGVLDQWNVDHDFPLVTNDLSVIADRLIEAGFRKTKIIGVANMGKKKGTTEVDFAESFVGYHGLIYGDDK